MNNCKHLTHFINTTSVHVFDTWDFGGYLSSLDVTQWDEAPSELEAQELFFSVYDKIAAKVEADTIFNVYEYHKKADPNASLAYAWCMSYNNTLGHERDQWMRAFESHEDAPQWIKKMVEQCETKKILAYLEECVLEGAIKNNPHLFNDVLMSNDKGALNYVCSMMPLFKELVDQFQFEKTCLEEHAHISDNVSSTLLTRPKKM